MMTLQPITLDLMEAVNTIRVSCGHETASHSFPSLFLWQRDLSLSVCLRENAFSVRSGFRAGENWFFPCGPAEAALELVQEIVREYPDVRFLYLRDEDKTLLQSVMPGFFRFEETGDASEYLFDRDLYMRMPGKAYEDIRWSINRLKRGHILESTPLCRETATVALEILNHWNNRHESCFFPPDRNTNSLLMQHFEALGLDGILVSVDGQPTSLAAGFPLSGRSYDIAFSKMLSPVRGLQYFTRRELIRKLPARFTIINGEEDLGLPGLRESKLQERPVGKIRMYNAYVR